MGLSTGCLDVLKTRQLTSSILRNSKEREPKAEAAVFYNLILEAIHHHLYHGPLVIQFNTEALWEGTIQGYECWEVGTVGAILEIGYNGS